MKEDIILRPEDLFQLNLSLTSILDSSQSEIVLLINKSGRLISYQAETSAYDAISISALVSGSFASSSSVANLIGETEFSSMYQAGSKMNLFLIQVDSNNILTVIFSKRSNLKKVKFAVESYKDRLIPVLANLYADVSSDPFLNLDVSSYNS